MNRYNKFKNDKKKRGKGNKPPVTQKTFDELIEEAIIQEEKGERYGDGQKARRFYETACDLYEQANAKDEKNFSCLYNWARVTYILATFSRPAYSEQKRINLLQLAIGRYRKALEVNDQALDALFNLKQALSSFGEMCLDEVSESAALPYFREACDIADRLFPLQLEVYQKNFSCCCSSTEDHPTTTTTSTTQQTSDNEDEEMYAEQTDSITINSLIDTLTSHAEDLNNLALIVMNDEESESLFNKALEKLAKANELVQHEEEHHKTEHEEENKASSMEVDEEDDEIDVNAIDSAYSTVLSSRADHLFSTAGILDASLFDKALAHQDKILKRIPNTTNSQVINQQRAEGLCNKGDIYCSYAEAIFSSGTDELKEGCTTQQLYRQALQCYEQAAASEETNNAIVIKVGDLNLTLAQTYHLMSTNQEDSAYQAMLPLIRSGLDTYRQALQNANTHRDTCEPIEAEIYLRIAKGLSYFPDKMTQCKAMLTKFIQMGGSLDLMQDDLQYVSLDFNDTIMNEDWFIKGMGQL